MSLFVRCPACGKNHKAPERAAGRTVASMGCGTPMTVPQPEPEPVDPADIVPEPDAAPAKRSETFGFVEEPADPEPPPPPRKKPKLVDVARLPPLTTNDPPLWRRHLHWLLILALFPLAVIGVPVVLHGLHDTCLKKDMNGVALLVAFASFGYLALLLSRLQTGDDHLAHRAMLREYQRRRAAMASDSSD